MIIPIKLINIDITSYNSLVCACVYLLRTLKIPQQIENIQYSVLYMTFQNLFIFLVKIYTLDQYTSIYLTFQPLANTFLLCFFEFVFL